MPYDASEWDTLLYAVEAGYDGKTLYFARTEIESGKHVGRFSPKWTKAYFAFKEEEKTSTNFEVSY